MWKGGWLHTGDIAYRDEEGYIKITDRLKDVIKSGGEWISSLELESMISKCPSIAQVAVIGVPDEKMGERPVAYVVLKKNVSGNPMDLCKDYLAGFCKCRKNRKMGYSE